MGVGISGWLSESESAKYLLSPLTGILRETLKACGRTSTFFFKPRGADHASSLDISMTSVRSRTSSTSFWDLGVISCP